MTSPHFQIHNLIEILGETVNPSKETIQQIKFGLEVLDFAFTVIFYMF